jgi:hypothetical protein
MTEAGRRGNTIRWGAAVKTETFPDIIFQTESKMDPFGVLTVDASQEYDQKNNFIHFGI